MQGASRLHSFHEGIETRWFRDVAACSQGQRISSVASTHGCAEHDNWDVTKLFVCFELSKNFEAVLFRQVQVEKNEVRSGRALKRGQPPQNGERLFAVTRADKLDLRVLVVEYYPGERKGSIIVFHIQNDTRPHAQSDAQVNESVSQEKQQSRVGCVRNLSVPPGTFPISWQAAAAPETLRLDRRARITEDEDVDGRKILIVEDEMITAFDLGNQLRRLGYRVSALAKSGEEAVRLAAELDPDLVIMDVNLAGAMNGIEASRRIQETRRIPVIYLTAYPNVFIRTPAQMQQPYLCVSKPFSVPELQTVIDIALRG